MRQTYNNGAQNHISSAPINLMILFKYKENTQDAKRSARRVRMPNGWFLQNSKWQSEHIRDLADYLTSRAPGNIHGAK